ncbi:MAG: helix-turn-helix domain-containing protein [Candidatus Didemnitutus sp.]|nr:helix-turn-helix domain-containing protein [Candidatus Didemnitutus sp.]
MKASTRQIISAALEGDETVAPEMRDALIAILAGKLSCGQSIDPKLLTMAEAARQLGVSRTWFWKKVRAEKNKPNPTFPSVEIQPGVFRFRRQDLLAFSARLAAYEPSSRSGQKVRPKQKFQRNKNASGN